MPVGQNNPQKCPFDLYCEQISGTAFTLPRSQNKRTWVYRTLPAVVHDPFTPYPMGKMVSSFDQFEPNPNQMRWRPLDIPSEPVDFLDGLTSWCGAGSPDSKAGVHIYLYTANKDMDKRAFYNADGEFLIVPQQGRLDIQTELGFLEVFPGEITVIPRGLVFSVRLPDGPSRGYICEIYESTFILPNLGPIGANGLANPRDFKYPVAAFEDVAGDYTVLCKFQGKMFQKHKNHSPFNVVAWFGNFAPYKYDLDLFCCMNSVTYDHPDPSIYCVLTAQTAVPGVAVIDFVIFPPRWEAKDHSFRPPWYHRNCMAEFMGLIRGQYEAKKDGFVPGGCTLHSVMTPHGPDAKTFELASNADISVPTKLADTMAFMFESTYHLRMTKFAQDYTDKDYYLCWQGLKNHFSESVKKQQQ
uniref:homogentisate 1,2-dioxygenase n=1 Tax=Arcella intermedia TaxID=1963864 RepID=A0A6B2L4R8_9EUKA